MCAYIDWLLSQNISDIPHKGFYQSYLQYFFYLKLKTNQIYHSLSISGKMVSPFTMFWSGEVLGEFCVCYALPMEALGREFLKVGEGGSEFPSHLPWVSCKFYCFKVVDT